MGKIFAYIRVSSREQNENRQLDALKGLNIDEIIVEKASGKNFVGREKYQTMKSQLRCGDLVIVKSIDRLGRNYSEILEQWRIITKIKKADIFVIDMPVLDTRRGKDLMGTFLSDIVLQVLSFVAENERENIRKRQEQGIAAAKKRGVRFGRPESKVPDNFKSIVRSWEHGSIRLEEVLEKCQMSKSTFYRRLREMRLKEGDKST